MLRPGDKVFYVGARGQHKHDGTVSQDGGLPALERNVVYIVREYDARTLGLDGRVAAVRLQGIYGRITRGTVVGDWEHAYCSCCFEPIKETYLEEFRKLTTPSPEVLKEKIE